MNRCILPFIAMAFASPVSAQSSGLGAPSDWSGGYLGVQIGFPAESSFTLDSAPGTELTLEGVVGGGQIGFRRQNDAFVYGAELEFLAGEQSIVEPGFPDTEVRTTTTRLGGQAGYALGRFLPYGTLGVARMTFQDTIGFGDTSSFGTFAGLGVDFQLGQYTSVGLEAIRESFTNFNENSGANVNQTNVSVHFNFHY